MVSLIFVQVGQNFSVKNVLRGACFMELMVSGGQRQWSDGHSPLCRVIKQVRIPPQKLHILIIRTGLRIQSITLQAETQISWHGPLGPGEPLPPSGHLRPSPPLPRLDLVFGTPLGGQCNFAKLCRPLSTSLLASSYFFFIPSALTLDIASIPDHRSPRDSGYLSP